MARHVRKLRPRQAALNEEPAAELDFENGDERSGRAGDRNSNAELREEFPPARVREAGMSGGETPDQTVDGKVTADDLAPETLLDESRSHSPAARARRDSADTVLSDAGEEDIGAGRGRDEAELAEQEARRDDQRFRKEREAQRR